MCLGRTFQLSRNIRQYRSFLQTDVKWLFLSILGLPEVWHVILHKNALFNISNFLTNGTILVNIRCCLSWEHILPSPFVAIGRRFSNAQNFYFFPFFKSNANVPSSLLQKTYSWKQSFFRNLPKGYNIDGKQFNKISRQKLPLSWYLFVAPFTSIEYILVSKVLKNNFAAFQKKNKFKLASFFGENLWVNFNFFQWNLLSKGN